MGWFKGRASEPTPIPVAKPIDPHLRFPAPSFEISDLESGQSIGSEQLRDFLSRVGQWRDRVLAWVAPQSRSGCTEGPLTKRSSTYLCWLLQSDWTAGQTDRCQSSPYNLAPFPVEALEGPLDDRSSVAAIIRWRAGVVDFLSDVWDVMGEPELDVFECARLDRLMTPVKGKNRCLYCLRLLGKDESAHYNRECPLLSHVRAKWPTELPNGITEDDLYE